MSRSLARVVSRLAPGLAALLAYQRRDLRFDVVAGLSVAAVALPVGIAYAEIARVPAVVGIYAAIFPLFAYALFGASRQLITGPDAATCIMAAASIGALAGGDPAQHAALMVALTLLTGVFSIIAGMARLGFIASFLSQPILVGYLNGIALIILVGQLPKLCGFASHTDGFFPQVAALTQHIDQIHPPTLLVGLATLALLAALQRLAPRLPGVLIVVVAGIVAAFALSLEDRGVAVLGTVPAGLPTLRWPSLDFTQFDRLLENAAAITLISFTSGVLTSKSFARRHRYDVDANRELIGFGASNLASGLVGGFPVTGAASRTAVNDVAGGRTQLTGVVAGVAMLIFLLFFTAPLTLLPTSVLAAIIVASACGLFDFAALRSLRDASGRELAFSLATTAGVLILGVFSGVLLAVLLSVLWLLSAGSRPHDAVLGRAPGVRGFHDIGDYPDATTIPGLLIYRFDADLVFYNCDHFRDRVLQHIADAAQPVEWVLIEASPINVIDYTAIQKLDELREELKDRGITLAVSRLKQSLHRYFRPTWFDEWDEAEGLPVFATVKAAIAAFEKRGRRGEG